MEYVKKRILWFSNTRCGYDELFKTQNATPSTGTWMESIASTFKNNNEFELAIAFHTKQRDKIVTKDNITYYPVFIKTSKSKISRIFNKVITKVSWYDEIEDYKKIINVFKPDLIHVFGSEENFGLLTNHTNIPIVLSIQGNLTVYQWKYFSGLSKHNLFSSFNFKNFIKFSTAYSKYILFSKRAIREQSIMSNMKNIIGRTDWDRRITKALSPKAKYFYNDEILRNKFYKEPKINPVLRDKLIISTMSGPAVYKGLETICMAITILNNLNINFVWNIGGIPKEGNLIKAVRKKLGKSFPEKNINFLGKLSETGIINMLKETNVYVMPSHIENGSIVLSEAMILGLPVVCTLAGGTSSRITDREEGLLIQSGDPWSMSGAILELKENYEQAINYGINARKRAIKRHNPEKVIESLNNIYLEIINDKN